MDDLTERITQAIRDADADTLGYERRTPDDGYGTHAAAVMSVVAPAIQTAKAEAWREYAAALEAVPDYAPTEYDKGRVDQRHATVEELHARATEYETGDQA